MQHTNPYEPPYEISTKPNTQKKYVSLPRAISFTLALGGTLWGILLIPFSIHPVGLVVFLPGYAVTYGYWRRYSSELKLSNRKFIWKASIVVNGAWLTFFLLVARQQDWKMTIFMICFAWWLFALLASLIAYLSEHELVDVMWSGCDSEESDNSP